MKLYLSLLFVALASASVSYDGYQVWRLEVDTKHHEPLRRLIDRYNLDVWAEGNKWMDIMVAPHMKVKLQEQFATIGLHSRISIPDVQALIDQERESMKENRADINFEQYNTFEDIEAYLIDLPATDSRTSLVSLGQTLEGRDLWQLKISTGGDKPVVWIDCGIHAREWITPATCLWGINYLLTGYGSDQAATDLLDAVDVLILTINNPDGYAYTFSDERLWRKNRNHYPENVCTGTDLNRNFDEHFGGDGSSSNSCDQTYHGPSPASELETQAVQSAIDSIVPNAKALFSIHSYSQLWMYAYGWTTSLPPDAADLDAISQIGVEALTSVHNTAYSYGPIATTIYPAAGTTVDYGYTAGITHSYTLELRDTGTYGFLLPAAQIVPTAEETWAGLIAAILAIP